MRGLAGADINGADGADGVAPPGYPPRPAGIEGRTDTSGFRISIRAEGTPCIGSCRTAGVGAGGAGRKVGDAAGAEGRAAGAEYEGCEYSGAAMRGASFRKVPPGFACGRDGVAAGAFGIGEPVADGRTGAVPPTGRVTGAGAVGAAITGCAGRAAGTGGAPALTDPVAGRTGRVDGPPGRLAGSAGLPTDVEGVVAGRL